MNALSVFAEASTFQFYRERTLSILMNHSTRRYAADVRDIFPVVDVLNLRVRIRCATLDPIFIDIRGRYSAQYAGRLSFRVRGRI